MRLGLDQRLATPLRWHDDLPNDLELSGAAQLHRTWNRAEAAAAPASWLYESAAPPATLV